MDANIDLKKIWNKQETNVPKVEELFSKLDQFKRNSLLKLILVNLTLLLTILCIGFIWYYYKPELITTKIGIILCILAMIIFLVPYNSQWSLLSTQRTEPNSKDYLQNLIQLKEKQLFQQTTMLSNYFIMLSLGIGLYLFEYVSKMTISLGVVVYAATILWIGANWFYIRPKIIKRQQEKTNNLISIFKKLSKQLEN
ncbi:hypothetical protein [Cellulophaga baltica]|uniref:Uncharacterized protein n=1 Tax=Cellulophaga baltica TaxID=76594 RepID=A0A1G7LSH7_9FLAO|nr:hypothetical protein [Cellulophaga baltica]SDF52467.1 hypothetical protein SAMN04487992_12113 [Cellulophaga baltica]